MENLIHYFEGIHPLSPQLRDHITKIASLRRVPKGELLLKSEEICRYQWYIKEGLIRAYQFEGNKEVTHLLFAEANIITSVKSYYDQVPSIEYIEALEDCTLYAIRYNDFKDTFTRYPEFNFIRSELIEKHYKINCQVLYAIRNKTAIERYQIFLETYPQLAGRVPDKYIASFLDMSPNYLSSIKGQVITKS